MLDSMQRVDVLADGYHWLNGIGAHARRLMRINYYWSMGPEPSTSNSLR
jgi:alpha-L-arabinofuranosidase